jgi:hypothetical protein
MAEVDGFSGGSANDPARMERIEDGHKLPPRHLDDLEPEELWCEIDATRNLSEMTDPLVEGQL